MIIKCAYPLNESAEVELEELRHELDSLVIKKDNVENEILKLSRKIDKIIMKYYKIKQAESDEIID